MRQIFDFVAEYKASGTMGKVTKTSTKGFIGNAQTVEMLKGAVMRGSGHAFLLHGPKHLGKRTIAEIITLELFGIKELSIHPDVLVIEPDYEKAQPIITVEQARVVRKFLSLTPSVAERKVVIVDGAELMNTSSANALLKSLEEPPGDALIFLISHNIGEVLPTIKSRTMPVRFALLRKEEIEEKIENSDAAEMCDGRPGLAILLSNDSELLDSLKRRRDAIIKLLDAPTITKLAYIAKAHDVAGPKTRDLPKQWLPALRKYMNASDETESATKLVRALFDAEKKLNTGALRPELILEEALLKI